VYVADLSVREAAERLDVHQSRVRELLASGRLAGRRVGSRWVVDALSVARRLETVAATSGRPLSTRIAWSAAAILDGQPTSWLRTGERSRLRARLRRHDATETQLYRWWMQTRSSATRYRLAEADVAELVSAEGVVAGGISAANRYGLGLGHGNEAEVYVDSPTARRLVDDFFLIESDRGNLTLHVMNDHTHWHRVTARVIDGLLVAPRLVVAVDLLDSGDTRSRSAGTRLLERALGTLGPESRHVDQ